MKPNYCYKKIEPHYVILWITPESSMAEIQRFVGIMGAFNAQGSLDPLQFILTPVKALKARLMYNANLTAVRQYPHPRFTHPTLGKKIIRYSLALELAKHFHGIPEGEKLTLRENY